MAPTAAEDPVLLHLLRDVRSARVRAIFFSDHKGLAEAEAEAGRGYTHSSDVRLLACSYNVAGRRPPPDGFSLADLAHMWAADWPRRQPHGAGASGEPDGGDANDADDGFTAGPPDLQGADIVAVGFQEVVPLSTGNALLGPSAAGADAWDAALASALNGPDWARLNAGALYGSGVGGAGGGGSGGGAAMAGAYAYGAQAAAAAVSAAMDRLWGGGGGGGAASSFTVQQQQQQQQGQDSDGAATAKQQQQQQQQTALTAADFDLAAAELRYGKVRAALAADDGEETYVQVATRQLVGLYLTVWARKRVARHIRGVQTTAVATGFGGYVGNKGAVAVRMRVRDAPLAIACCHLPSGDGPSDAARRSAAAGEILRRCAFPTDAEAAALGASLGVGGGGGAGGGGFMWGNLSALADHGNVVVVGDLNYRLDASKAPPDAGVRAALAAGRFDKLLAADELRAELAAGRAFPGFVEGVVDFLPTYKYVPGTDVYAGGGGGGGSGRVTPTESSASLATDGGGGDDVGANSDAASSTGGGGKQKRRTPAWCDRILWLNSRHPGGKGSGGGGRGAGAGLHQLAYGRAELTASDHRPVAAAFLLRAHRYHRGRVAARLEAARREVDAGDAASRPRLDVGPPRFLDFGLVEYGAARELSVPLANPGRVPAPFYFVAPPCARPAAGSGGGGGGGKKRVAWDDEQPVAPPWLLLAPDEGVVAPGKTRELRLRVRYAGGAAADALADAPPAAAAAPGKDKEGAAAELGGEGLLDAILILRVEDGSDAFISATGAFVRSAFGRPFGALSALGAAPAAGPLAALSAGARELRAAADQAGRAAAAAEAASVGSLTAGAAEQQEQQQGGDGGVATSEDEPAAAAAAAASAVAAASARASDALPKEVAALVNFLAPRLATPGLFVHSVEAACGLPRRGRARPEGEAAVARALAAIADVRWALDTSEPIPLHATAHQAAAALLMLFHQLPGSFLPPSVDAVLRRGVPAAAAPFPAAAGAAAAVEGAEAAEAAEAGAAALLYGALPTPADAAVARAVLALLRAALSPPLAALNGLTLFALSELLAAYWFRAAHHEAAATAAVPPELVANRIAFCMALLDDG